MKSLSKHTALTPAGSGAGDLDGKVTKNSQQMAGKEPQKFRYSSSALNAAAAHQKAVTEDDFLHALQKQQVKLENNNGLLAELVRIEQDMREKLQLQEERQQELKSVREEENRQRWRNLSFLILNQRTAKYHHYHV
ncbi:hypothetical protein Baya_9601 [Bagarius yarrelli]|uniref:Uncharacterized protein n=1 Tax=Bagarius yarrelli TaxID=175774 RepID=A0A556UXN4_BAGYA|nr:hypothetical protein Baya_9601 [Bagarius yarrelli]